MKVEDLWYVSLQKEIVDLTILAIFQKSKQENEKSRHFDVSARCSFCIIFELDLEGHILKIYHTKIKREKIGRRGDVTGKLILDSRKGILKLKIRGKSNKKKWWGAHQPTLHTWILCSCLASCSPREDKASCWEDLIRLDKIRYLHQKSLNLISSYPNPSYLNSCCLR